MRAASISTAIAVLAFCSGSPLAAEPTSQASIEAHQAATSAYAQAEPARRAPPRVTITPRQPGASLYPSPYPYAYPGPGYARQCTSWLEPEARPSGAVIVPRMRCWWVRG